MALALSRFPFPVSRFQLETAEFLAGNWKRETVNGQRRQIPARNLSQTAALREYEESTATNLPCRTLGPCMRADMRRGRTRSGRHNIQQKVYPYAEADDDL